MDQTIQVSEPLHYFHHCPVQTNPVMFNNMHTTNVVTNTTTRSQWFPLDTTFSISTKASNYGCIWIQSPHTIDFTNAPDIQEILGLEGRTVILSASFYGSNVIDITRNHQVIQVYSSLVRSSDLKIAN